MPDPEPEPVDGAGAPVGGTEMAPARRRRAVALAGHEGDVAAARAALGDADPGVRATALRALGRAGGLGTHELEVAAGDADAAVRRTAAEVAASADAVHGIAVVLDRLLDDGEPLVVEAAAWACGEQPGTPATTSRLISIAREHEDVLCREAAVAALGAIGDDAGLPAILDALDDKATVRRRAVIALAPFEGDDVEAALHRHLTDRDVQVRQAAEDLLGRDRGRAEGGAEAPPS
jgi:HEAT repeat protein